MPKRRAVVDSDSEDNLANGSTASKRARTADSDSDSEVEAQPNLQQTRPTNQQPKGKKRAQEDSDDVEMHASDLDDEEKAEEFDRQYSDSIRASVEERFRKKGASGGVAEFGIIEGVEMHNFMCHKYLNMNFGPQINFIIGHNGSGKSAVLSAITVALGGKSNSTGRGTGLKSFIREGSQWAEATVQIKNQGDEAFKPSEYGSSISITRRFTKEGNSTWKIRQGGKKDGKIVSHKKEELSAICDHMNIQVDNPMSVLTQDAARQFLSASTPADKYKFFLKGTQLQQLSEEYDICLENIQTTTKILSQKKEAIPELLRQLEEATRRFEEARKAREQKQKIDDLKKEKAWAHVQEKQDELHKKMREKATEEKRIPDVAIKVTKTQNTLSAIEERVNELTNRLDNLDDTHELEKERAETQAKIKANSAVIRGLQSDMKLMQSKKVELENQIRGYDDQIVQERNRLAQDTDAKRSNRQRALAEAQDLIAQAQAAFDATKTRQSAVSDEDLRLKQCLDGAKANVQELQNKIASYENNISQAHRAEQDKFIGYGHNIDKLLHDIQSTNWHGEVPIGPLGIHVHARDHKWGELLRKQLSALLTSFAITDPRDRQTLKQMLVKSRNANCNIIISKRDNFDYTHGEPPPHFHTILRELVFNNETVLRIFINQRRIEKTILAATRREADQSMRNGLHGTFEAWTLDKFSVRVYGGGGSQSAPLGEGNKNVHFTLLMRREAGTELIQQYAAMKQDVERERGQAHHVLENLKQEFFANKDQVKALHEQGRKNHLALQAAKFRYTNIQEEANEELPADIAAFEACKQEATSEIESLMTQFEDAANQKAPLDQENKDFYSICQEVKQRIEGADAVKDRITVQVEDEVTKRLKAQADIKYWENKVKAEQEKVDNLEQLVNVCTEEFTNWRKQALEYTNGTEVPNPRSVQIIEKHITSTNKALQQREAIQRASVEDLADGLTRANTKYETVSREYKEMARLNKVLKQALIKRLYKWQEFRLHIALRCKHTFSYHLSQRAYYGKVLFSHSKGTLDLKVQTDEQTAAGKNQREKDAKSLSGGEKSFSTICLLLSLWDSIGCPLRCLDEFDVFMDAVNRRISMKMMIDTANSSSERQYILITPQDMSNINHGPTVRIQRMADPERGQGMLEFRSH